MLHICKLKSAVVFIIAHVASCNNILHEVEMTLSVYKILLGLEKWWEYVQQCFSTCNATFLHEQLQGKCCLYYLASICQFKYLEVILNEVEP